MDAQAKINGTHKSPIRVVVLAALVSVMLGGCSVVPDAVNPVKWYQKTTDFFSGDRQASTPGQGLVTADNQGLAADPNAPAPAQVQAQAPQDITQAAGGLRADAASSGYSSPALARQSAPRDVLMPSDTVALNTPPAPVAQPSVAVTPSFVAPPPAPNSAPQPLNFAQTSKPALASASKSVPGYATPPTSPPKRLSFADAPPPHDFKLPDPAANARFGGDQFETVIISGNGMEGIAPSTPRKFAVSSSTISPVQGSGAIAQFPTPGTTSASMAVASGNYANMARVATIHFANNSSNMDARDLSILGAVIQLQKERGGRVIVIGHASSRTKDMDYIRHKMVNFQISMQRATSIGEALKSKGLNDNVLEIQAVSDAQPQYLEVMPSGEVGNRRVEIYLAAL